MVTLDRAPGEVLDLFDELRRAAVAAHGEAITNASGTITLPRSQQVVALARSTGAWRVRASEDDADVLVPIFPSTGYGVAVREGARTAGATSAADAAPVFPSLVQPMRGGGSSWCADACLTQGGVTATVSVVEEMPLGTPPTGADAASVRALVVAVLASYGLVETAPPPPPLRRREPAAQKALVAGYAGAVRISPEVAGDDTWGGLAGIHLRSVRREGVGLGAGIGLELGWAGEAVGELRVGAGLSIGLGAVAPYGLVGLSVGSTGPADPLDGYVQGGAVLDLGGVAIDVAVMRAVGVDVSHDRLDVAAYLTREHDRGDRGYVIGVRALDFGTDKSVDFSMPLGTGVIVYVGAGSITR